MRRFDAVRATRDEGQMILAIMSLILVSMIASTTLAVVLGGQKQTQFDQQFEQALSVAERGLEQMAVVVQTNPDTLASPQRIPAAPSSWQALPDGSKFAVDAVKSGTTWTLTSQGVSRDGRQRTVTAEVKRGSVFTLAAFGKFFADFNGGNGADSFDSRIVNGTRICQAGGSTPSTAWVTDPSAASQADAMMCNPTNNGAVGTNGRMFLKGQTVDQVDRVDIYNAKEVVPLALQEPAATGFCDGVPALCNQKSNPNVLDTLAPTSSGDVLRYHAKPMDVPPITVCNGGSPTGSFGGAGTLTGGTHHYTDATLTSATVFTGTPTNPTILCLKGKLTVPNGAVVNFKVGPNGYLVPRESTTLYVFSTYSGSGDGLSFGNHASISAAVYAPDASFGGGSQGNVYGSLVASSIDNNGGWNFHYDEALGASPYNAPVRVQNWAEIP